jgi:uncharacterized protein YheU (UPF0270 family)
MIIPPQQLSPETLQAVLEEFISREGTDYGDREWALEEKVSCLRPQVLQGQVLIIFDPVSEQINLVPRDEWREPG